MLAFIASSRKNLLSRFGGDARNDNTWPAVRKKVLAVIALFILFFLLLFLLPWDK
ncbi:MAG: hypothetical protein ALAOOOJD_01435 [bacterium]|nr:hypothetical protein [bacterium]